MILQAKNITKTYFEGTHEKRLTVLDNLDFSMKQGEIVSITGLSGSGKSTLLHILGTLDKPDSGSVIFYDVDIRSYNEGELAHFRNMNIGFVFQFHHLLPELTTVENVAMPKMISGASYKESIQASEELLASLDLVERSSHYPHQLSGGEQQRVAVARALINNPDIVLADEPTGNLDSIHSQELTDLLWSLNQRFDTSVLLVTHNQELAKCADHVYNLEKGKLHTLSKG
ncbi:MAG: ABC transporter ATP-binding protein [Candidatus Cloacimonetes bacterium]|nr:ABC transporter ATP-binding protein [Candidatus Cloacimonadota bacterium]